MNVSAEVSQAAVAPRTRSAQPDPAEGSQARSQHSSVEDDNPRPRKRFRFVPVKKVADPFDDDFNPDAIAAYEEEDSGPPKTTQTRGQHPARSQIIDEDVSVKGEPVSSPLRNKSRTPDLIADSDNSMDDLLPAAAAMRKEKQREEAEARRKGLPVKSAIAQTSTGTQEKPRKEVKLLDVREAVRARKEAEDEAVKKEREELDELRAEDEGRTGPANLVKIVEYQLPVREKTNGMNNYHGETWKPEWDGRKNFKGFRRARDVANGSANGIRRPRDKIIVPLVPVKKDTYGLGDQYWEKTQEDKERAAREKERKKRASQRSSQSQKQSTRQSQRSATVQPNSDLDDSSSVEQDDNGETEPVSPETARLQKEAEHVLHHPVNVDAPRQTRGAETQASNSGTASTGRSTKGHKRVASKDPPGKNAAAKKQKTLPITVVHGSDSDEQDDDSDDMKFQFGRARKTRAAKS